MQEPCRLKANWRGELRLPDRHISHPSRTELAYRKFTASLGERTASVRRAYGEQVRRGQRLSGETRQNLSPKGIGAGLIPKPLVQSLRRLWWARALRSDASYQGVPVPTRDLREMMCGRPYSDDDDFFMSSGLLLARNLARAVKITPDTSVVDVGCGLARLAIGLILDGREPNYLGIDSHDRYIWWCKTNIQRKYPKFRFQHLDVENERYNPGGTRITPMFRLPVIDGAADVVHFWGVLTNMHPDHLSIYVSEVSRMLRPGGSAFVSAWVEEGVPTASINPEGYVSYPCVGPLHVVRYEHNYLRSVFASHSLAVKSFAHHTIVEKQSEFHLEKQFYGLRKSQAFQDRDDISWRMTSTTDF